MSNNQPTAREARQWIKEAKRGDLYLVFWFRGQQTLNLSSKADALSILKGIAPSFTVDVRRDGKRVYIYADRPSWV